MIDLNWHDIYYIKNDRINTEHKNLFLIAKKAFDVVDPKLKASKVKEILKELIAYTQTHFEHEEKFMKSINFPKLHEHKEKHKSIIILIHNFIKDMSSMKVNEIEKELAHDIEIWFVHHIINEDKKISNWISTNGISEEVFIWQKDYAKQNTFLEEGYKKLLDNFNKLYKSTSIESSTEKIKEKILATISNINGYFKKEYPYLQEINYDKIPEHKKSNNALLYKLENICKTISNNNKDDISDALYDFIENDFSNYMLKASKNISFWIKFSNDIKEAQELKDL